MSTPAEEVESRRLEWDAEPVCPNEDDPLMCKVQDDGTFVPECGCPVHDPEPVELQTDICVCGHKRAGHHRLCNGHVGKFWCTCRTFKLLRREDES